MCERASNQVLCTAEGAVETEGDVVGKRRYGEEKRVSDERGQAGDRGGGKLCVILSFEETLQIVNMRKDGLLGPMSQCSGAKMLLLVNKSSNNS